MSPYKITFRLNRRTQHSEEDGAIGGQIELTERQQAVLALIEDDKRISRKEMAARLTINESAVQKHLKALTELSVIERIGTRNGYWKILITGKGLRKKS